MPALVPMVGFLLAAPCAAQQDPTGDLIAIRGGAFEEGPYQRAELLSETGEAHFPVTTENPEAQQFFDQGIGLLHGFWLYEAERSFHTAAALDPDCAMAYWGMAMANVNSRHRAVEFAWDAFQRRGRASVREQMFIDSYARFLGAEEKPVVAIVDPSRGTRQSLAAPVTRESRDRLLEDLAAIVRAFPDDIEARAFLVRERIAAGDPAATAIEDEPLLDAIFEVNPQHPAHVYRLAVPAAQPPLDAVWKCVLSAPAIGTMWYGGGRALAAAGRHAGAAWLLQAAARVHHSHMLKTGAMPYEVHGYADTLESLYRSLREAGRHREATDAARSLIELPRHPRLGVDSFRLGMELELETWMAMADDADDVATPSTPAVPVDLPALASLGPPRWSPPAAPPFELPLGQGGVMALSDFAGRPVLVVFFLGFGCVHCVEQLRELQPRVGDFAEAGIEIVTIGTDTVDQVRASFQMAIENDEPRMPFPILCDPGGAQFKSWRCWDEFEDTALHGTFLVDGEGRIRWRDVSVEPFMETDFLLSECVRLLALPEPGDK